MLLVFCYSADSKYNITVIAATIYAEYHYKLRSIIM